MRARRSRGTRALAVLVVLAAVAAGACSGDSGTDPEDVRKLTIEGTLDDGATWQIFTPQDWNGTLLLYSHGYASPASKNTVTVSLDGVSAQALLDRGFALAASSYAHTGWAVEEAIDDQLELLDVFADEVAEPERTIAWGVSMGGLITTALLEQHPDRFDGGLAMCGVLAGSVALWDRALDLAFALEVLLTPDPRLQLVDITTDQTAVATDQVKVLTDATKTTAGRARLALIGTLAGQPAPQGQKDFVAEATNVATAIARAGLHRAELEERFGGNPSTNDGVDYAALLDGSVRRDEVAAKYQAAGLDLQADLAALADAPRFTADAAARQRLAEFATPTAELTKPLLTMHTTGDPVATPAQEAVYAARADAAGTKDLLRQLAVDRAGHCNFLPDELVTAIDVIDERVVDGTWPSTDAVALERIAAPLRLQLTTRPAFVDPDFPADPRLEASAEASTPT